MVFWLLPLRDGLILRELAPGVVEELLLVLPGLADGNLELRDLATLLLLLLLLLLPLLLLLLLFETVLVARLLIFFALRAISLYVVSSSTSLLTMLSVGSP